MIVDQVVALLKAHNIRTAAACPSGRTDRVTVPVAAVSVEQVNGEAHTTAVLIEVLAPRESGGYACQKKALEVCGVLEAEGAVCHQGKCTFVRHSDLFRVPVTAVFQGVARTGGLETVFKPVVIAGGMNLTCLKEFSAQQEVVGSNATIYESPWEFTVEEFFPWGVFNTLEPDEPFTMDLRHSGHIERFERCQWTYRQRITEPEGIRQIRKGKATGRILTSE